MKPFAFDAPADLSTVCNLLREHGAAARVIAGGSDLLGELKNGLVHYPRLVSLAGVAALHEVRPEGAGLHLGAGVTLAGLEREPLLTGPHRLLAEAARGVATPEIRNQGTLGGNLCQRPRCLHYRSPWLACVKKGGEGCPARDSEMQAYLSVMGGQDCFAVNPSDLAPALLTLDAAVVLAGPGGERTLPLADFLAGPDAIARQDNALAKGEVLAAVRLPPAPEGWRGTALKARERTAGDFALVGVAAGCRLADGRMQHVRLALGGVAAAPARVPAAEAILEGQVPSPEGFAAAAEAAFASAAPLPHNGYKLELGRALVRRALEQVTAG